MLKSLSTTRKGILSAFCGFTFFAIADASAKWLGQFHDTAYVLFWSYLLALFLGTIFSPLLGGLKKTIKTKKLLIHLGRGVCAFGIAAFVVASLKTMSLAALYTILFLSPFLTTIAAAPVFKEKVSSKSWAIIIFGFSGVLVAFRPDITEFTADIVYAFIALMFIVGLGLLSRPIDNDETLLSLSFYPSLTIVFFLGTTLLPDVAVPDIEHLPVFALNAFCVVMGLSGIAYGYRIAPFAMVAPVHYTQMVVALILGYFVFGDWPTIWMFAGSSIIVISGLLLVVTSSNGEQQKSEEMKP